MKNDSRLDSQACSPCCLVFREQGMTSTGQHTVRSGSSRDAAGSAAYQPLLLTLLSIPITIRSLGLTESCRQAGQLRGTPDASRGKCALGKTVTTKDDAFSSNETLGEKGEGKGNEALMMMSDNCTNCKPKLD